MLQASTLLEMLTEGMPILGLKLFTLKWVTIMIDYYVNIFIIVIDENDMLYSELSHIHQIRSKIKTITLDLCCKATKDIVIV